MFYALSFERGQLFSTMPSAKTLVIEIMTFRPAGFFMILVINKRGKRYAVFEKITAEQAVEFYGVIILEMFFFDPDDLQNVSEREFISGKVITAVWMNCRPLSWQQSCPFWKK